MRPLRRVALVLLVAVVMLMLAVGGLVVAAATDGGTRWLLERALPLLRAQGVDVTLDRSEGALLRRVELTGLALSVRQNRVVLDRLLLHWRPRALLDRHLHVRALEIDGLDLALAPAADEAPPTVPAIPDIVLPVTIAVDRAVLDGLVVRRAGGDLVLDRLALGADLDRARLAVRGLEFRGLGARADGELALGLAAPHRLDGDLRLGVDAGLTGPDVGPVAGRARLGGAALAPELVLDVDRPAVLRARARADLGRLEPAFDVEAGWQTLRWPPLGDDEIVRLCDGRLAIAGTAADYRLESTLAVSGPGVPDTAVDLEGDGDLDGLRLRPLRLALLDGTVEVEGRVGWAGVPAWDLAVDASGLDPSALLPDLPGRLGGRLAASGAVDADGVTARIEVGRFGGTLRDYPVDAVGLVEVDGTELQLTSVRIASGDNYATLGGRLGETLDLRAAIAAPALEAAYPGLTGDLQGAARIRGTRDAPTVEAELRGRHLGFEDNRVATVDLAVDWQPEGGEAGLVLRDAVLAGSAVTRAEARLGGRPDAHELAFSVDSDAGRASLDATGGWRDAAWSGRLQSLQLDEPSFGRWRLQEPVDLRLAQASVRAGRLCLAQPPARLCAQGRWDAGGDVEAATELRDFDLASLAPLLPETVALQGRVGADVTLGGRADAPRLDLTVRPGDGSVSVATEQETFVVEYSAMRLDGRFDDDRGEATLGLRVGMVGAEPGSVDGRLSLGPAPGPDGAGGQGGRPLGGAVRAEFPDLALVSGFVPDLRDVRGALRLRADVAGTLGRPTVAGELRVEDAAATLPAAGIELSEIDLAVLGDGTGPVELQGQLRSGEGVLRLDGRFDLGGGPGLPVELAVTGDRFLAAQLPEARVFISPDLRLSGREDYRLTGTVRVPEARIEVQSLPESSVRVSGDEIVVGEDDPGTDGPQAPGGVSGIVSVVLGDDVTLDGFGLETGLEGVLDVAFGSGDTLVDGSISLRDGRYQSFGQDLTIEQGRLLFAGPPDRPELDLRASRRSRDGTVVAFLAMSGPLTEPRPRIFTEPPLPEEEAVAYLVTGRGLAQAGEGDGLNIASAAFALGVSQGEPWLQELGGRFGIDELRFETGDDALEQTSLVLGKYLNPDLFVGYTQELFNPEGALLLRLRLHQNFEVETRSGRDQSVDFIFRREHD